MIAIEEWRKAARRAEFGGREIAWWTSPETDLEKPFLLLIHGFPTSSWDWSALWPALEAHFRLAALDMLGFGLSEKPTDIRYSILHQADLQEALLERLGVGEAHILAHDYGDTVAQELLARHNEGSLSFSIKSLCFLNGGLFPERHRALLMQKLALTPLGPLIARMMSRARFAATFDRILGPHTKASDNEIEAHWSLLNESGGRRILHKLMRYIPERVRNRERWVGAMKSARAPMRLIDGGADPISGAHMHARYLEEIPQPDAVLLENIGHYPHAEAPEAVLSAFLDFHRKLGTIAA